MKAARASGFGFDPIWFGMLLVMVLPEIAPFLPALLIETMEEEVMAEEEVVADASHRKPRLVGLNHIALEVGDLEAALEWYGRIFDFTLRGRGEGRAFIELGDQFIALSEGRRQPKDEHRHFGLVVDDRSTVKALLEEVGAELVGGPFLDFRDPWGNRIEVVEYRDIQFTKAPHVLRGMALDGLEKSGQARAELERKGMAP